MLVRLKLAGFTALFAATALFAVLVPAFMGGCASGPGAQSTPPGSSVAVTLNITSTSVQTSGTAHFIATVENSSDQNVTWQVNGIVSGNSTVGTISNGTFTAPTTIPNPAVVTVLAVAEADPTKMASAQVTIISASVTGGISITITPKWGGLTVSQTVNVTAQVANDVAAAGVTWSASGSSCAGNACGTFTNITPTSATFAAPATAGVIDVTATSKADGSKSASATIGVTNLAGVFTYHNDLARDGVNSQEFALTTSNLTTNTFGKLFSCTVDGAIYAQPLWVANLTIGGAKRNAVFVATTHNTVYAFDADASPCKQLWKSALMPVGETWASNSDTGSTDIPPDIGIIGTPVVDPVSRTLYVVTKSKTTSSSVVFHQRLHGVSLLDGSEPVAANDLTSAISVSGTGDGSSGGKVPFNPLRQNQRPGLVLANDVVYVSWASHGDLGPFHGWLIGFDKSTLKIVSTFNANPDGSDCGIWMSGGAPSVDSSGNMYLLTGNGTFDANTGGHDYGDSTLKLSTSSGLSVAGYFTPADQQDLNGADTDHGAGGAAVLLDQPAGSPHEHLVIGGGKEGNLFLLDRDNMGGYGADALPADSNAVQKFSIGNAIFATAAFWNNALYIAGIGGPLKSYAFITNTGKFNPTQTSQSAASFGFPGATPSISASGSSNGIVWALDNSAFCTTLSTSCGPAVLHALDATNVASELWNSSQNASRDAAGNAVKFTVPTVANGKVYVGTRGNNQGGAADSTSIPGELTVYGLLPN
jgi:hypothetical protein